MLTQLLNIDWDITNVMLGIIIFLGIIVFFKSLGIFIRILENTHRARNVVNKQPIKKANNE